MKCVYCQTAEARPGAKSQTCGDRCYQQQKREAERETLTTTPIEAIDHFNMGRFSEISVMIK